MIQAIACSSRAGPNARAEFTASVETLERRLGDGPFLMGERFTVPDLLLGHCVGWAAAARFAVPGGRLGAYFRRIRDRPAYARTAAASRG